MTKLLLIAEDVTYLSTLTSRLTHNGYQVVSRTRAQDGFKGASQERPDLIILDVGMSPMDGLQTCRRFRTLTATPIMMVTARSDEAALIQGLEAGADAYLVKPFSQRLLLAKIAALLRRSGHPHSFSAPYTDGYLELDLPHESVSVKGQAANLTTTELCILAYLFRHADRVVPYAELLQAVGGDPRIINKHALQTTMYYLRRKIEPDPHHPIYLKTVWGIGYQFYRATTE